MKERLNLLLRERLNQCCPRERKKNGVIKPCNTSPERERERVSTNMCGGGGKEKAIEKERGKISESFVEKQ